MDDLNLYQFQDIIASKWLLFFAGFSLYISLLSGYLAVAYFVGRKLTTFQVVGLTAIYLPTILMCAGTTIGFALAAASWNDKMFDKYGIYEGPPGLLRNTGGAISMLIFLSAILLSLFFMWNVRRRANR